MATALLEVLMRQRPKGVERIVTVIRASNAASLAMLRRLGEVEVSRPEAGAQDVEVELAAGSGANFRRHPLRVTVPMVPGRRSRLRSHARAWAGGTAESDAAECQGSVKISRAGV